MEKQVITVSTDGDEGLHDLLQRCNRKKVAAKDVAQLRAFLERRADLALDIIDLGGLAVGAMAESYSGGNVLLQEAVIAQVRAKAAALMLPGDGETERALAETAAVCWLRWTQTERAYSHLLHQGTTIKNAESLERRLNGAHNRFLRSCETLARVRRLLRPLVQVNVAEAGSQVVNVAGDVKVDRKG